MANDGGITFIFLKLVGIPFKQMINAKQIT